MPKITGGTVVKLLIASLLVGLVLAILNIDPQNVLQSAREGAEALIEMGASVFGWAFKYILIGAVVVVPIWLALYLWRYLRGKKN
jgi:hypothetical protein